VPFMVGKRNEPDWYNFIRDIHERTGGVSGDLIAAGGLSGGQTLIGGLDAGDDLHFKTTAHATPGTYFFDDLTTNGFMKTSGGTGAVTIDTDTHLTVIQVDGVGVSTGSPTLDFDGTDFTLSESPTDTFDITLNAERIQDIAGAMFSGNTETGITITYQDSDGTIDAVVSDLTVAGDSGSTGMTPGDTLTIAGGTNATTAMSGDTLTVNVDDAFILNTGDTGTGVYDFGGADSFEIPNSATPTVNADGEIAVDTSVTDFSHGVLEYYGGEQMGVVAMPIAQFSSPTNGYVVTYNSTNDEFELAAPAAASSQESVLLSLFLGGV
jgi:hypothetical protein